MGNENLSQKNEKCENRSRNAHGLAVEFSPVEPYDDLEYFTDSVSINVPSGHLLAVQIAQRIIESNKLSLLRGIELYSDCAWWMMTESDGRRQEWQVSNGLIFIISISTLKDWFYRTQVPLPFTAAEVCHQFLCDAGVKYIKWWDAEDWGVSPQEWSGNPSELRNRDA